MSLCVGPLKCCIRLQTVSSLFLSAALWHQVSSLRGWHSGMGGREMERRLAGLSVSVLNWHYLFLSFFLSVCLPSLYHSLSVVWPSGQSICLPSLSDLSFTMTQAIQKRAHTQTQSARLLGQLCVSTALSHISAYCSKETTPRLPNTHWAPLHIAFIEFTCSTMKRNTHLDLKTFLPSDDVYSQQQTCGQRRIRWIPPEAHHSEINPSQLLDQSRWEKGANCCAIYWCHHSLSASRVLEPNSAYRSYERTQHFQ